MIMREADQEEEDHRVLAQSGFGGTVASIGMGILDPLIFIPAGPAIDVLKGSRAALKAGTALAAATGAQVAIQESIFQMTQPGRYASDSAFSIGTATLLGGLIGAGAGALLSRAEKVALRQKFNLDRVAMGEEIAGRPMPAAAGAAAVDERTLDLRSSFGVAEALTAVPGLRRVVSGPTIRTFMKPFTTARRAMADLAETPLQFEDSLKGISTTKEGGPALSRLASTYIDTARVNVNETLDRLYASYRFGWQETGYGGQTVAKVKGLIAGMGAKRSPEFTPREFREEVGRAMRRADESDIPEVRQAAETIRKTVFDPWKERAIAAGLLPEDIGVKTALS
ncbi:MAG: hypothetical protein ACREIB_08330, partial [Pseudomonadota bacterium]